MAKAGSAAALLALPAVFAACGSSDSDESTASDVDAPGSSSAIPSLTWALGASVAGLDIAKALAEDPVQIMTLALEGLVAVDGDSQVVPRLAESWSQPDELHYVYQLRPDVKFWDGTPLTVDDVVYSLSRHLDTAVASQIGFMYARVKSVKATGPMEVTVELNEPDPEFQYTPAISFITPKKFSEKLGENLGVAGPEVNIMGTGPYRVTKFDNDTGATLVRNPDYWGDAGAVEKAVLEIIEDPNDRLLALESGDIAGTSAVPIESIRDFSRMDDVALGFPEPLSVTFISFDVTRAPFDDVHVRRAIAYAADKAGYVQAFLHGSGSPAKALSSPDQFEALVSSERAEEIFAEIPGYSFSLEDAAKELAMSAHPDGFKASIGYPSTERAFGRALVSLSESLAEIGIDLEVRDQQTSAWLADIYAHSEPVIGNVFLPTSPDPTGYLNSTCLSSNAGENGLNTANFKNARVDRLLHEQAAALDKEERASIIGELLTILGQELPYLPLWWSARPIALRTDYVYHDFTQLFYLRNWLADIQRRG